MDQKQLLEKFKSLEWKKLIYPAISGFFFIITLLLFLSGAKFLSNSINKTFTVESSSIESDLTRINFNNLDVVAKKLGIEIKSSETSTSPNPTPVEVPAPQPEPPPVSQNENEVAGPVAPTPAPTPAVEDKKSLKIEVLNSTKTAGLAGELKTLIENSGYVVEKTGNSSPVAETTSIKVKAETQSAFPTSVAELKQIVSSKYSSAAIDTLEPDSPYNIVITIGKK